jgi:hypothetical protein
MKETIKFLYIGFVSIFEGFASIFSLHKKRKPTPEIFPFEDGINQDFRRVSEDLDKATVQYAQMNNLDYASVEKLISSAKAKAQFSKQFENTTERCQTKQPPAKAANE